MSEYKCYTDTTAVVDIRTQLSSLYQQPIEVHTAILLHLSRVDPLAFLPLCTVPKRETAWVYWSNDAAFHVLLLLMTIGWIYLLHTRSWNFLKSFSWAGPARVGGTPDRSTTVQITSSLFSSEAVQDSDLHHPSLVHLPPLPPSLCE